MQNKTPGLTSGEEEGFTTLEDVRHQVYPFSSGMNDVEEFTTLCHRRCVVMKHLVKLFFE